MSKLTARESALHVVGCVCIGLITVGVAFLLLWVAVHGGAALASARHSAVLPFGLIGYCASLFALGCIVIGLVITLNQWQGIFSDIARNRAWWYGRRSGGVK